MDMIVGIAGKHDYGQKVTEPAVLVIGLDPYRVPGPWDPTPVAVAIEESVRRFADSGIDATNCLIGLDGSDDVEAVVTNALRERPWECVLIGGGIRKDEEQLELFELVVNLTRRHAPDAAIAFNRNLTDIVDAVVRQLARRTAGGGRDSS
ncbi:hypothetical protein GCM10022235_50690 [Kribbella ginsengisoli]|uniref:Uncharacterized protein n=1 Tax=Kribbella ginsengisoli TaxID=363865 RepID=A0ABP6Y0Q8_9ACTN